MHRQYDITILQRHLDAIVLTYSVSPRSDSSTTDTELTQPEFNSTSDSHSDSDIQITGVNCTSHPPMVAQPTSISEQFNRWSPTASEADFTCAVTVMATHWPQKVQSQKVSSTTPEKIDVDAIVDRILNLTHKLDSDIYQVVLIKSKLTEVSEKLIEANANGSKVDLEGWQLECGS